MTTEQPAKIDDSSTFRKIQLFPEKMARTVKDGLNAIASSITGKNVEDRLSEYTEVYGEILIGLHEDVEELKKAANSRAEDFVRLEETIFLMNQRIEAFASEGLSLKKLRRGIWINRFIILATVGTVVWLAYRNPWVLNIKFF